MGLFRKITGLFRRKPKVLELHFNGRGVSNKLELSDYVSFAGLSNHLVIIDDPWLTQPRDVEERRYWDARDRMAQWTLKEAGISFADAVLDALRNG